MAKKAKASKKTTTRKKKATIAQALTEVPSPKASLLTAEELISRDDTFQVVISGTGEQQKLVRIRRVDMVSLVLEGKLDQTMLKDAQTFLIKRGNELRKGLSGWLTLPAAEMEKLLFIMRSFVCATSVEPLFVMPGESPTDKEVPVEKLKTRELIRIWASVTNEIVAEGLEGEADAPLSAVK
jgi:hypothetical protein